MVRPRDNQRIRVYRAGWDFKDSFPVYMPRVPDIQSWVDQILHSAWWKEQRQRWSFPTWILVKDGRGRRNGGARREYTWEKEKWLGIILLPRTVRYQCYILHELAHLMQSPFVAWHGPGFVRFWVVLVDEWMGQKAGAILRECLVKHRVSWYDGVRSISSCYKD